MSIENITISRAVYEELLRDQEWLDCLEQAGVDNWPGIDYAYKILEQYDDEDD